MVSKVNHHLIANWHEQNNVCKFCGTNKSVKYEILGMTFCHKDVIPASMILEGNPNAFGKQI